MRIDQHSRLQLRLQSIIFLLLFLSTIGVLAWLSYEYNMRSDWTVNQRNSLSRDTIELLHTLKQPVIIRSYQLDDDGSVQAATEILKNYQRIKADVQFKVLNPDLDIELAKADKIERYGQSLIQYNGKHETIDNLSEQEITNALLRLSREKAPLLAFVDNHGERDPQSDSNTGYLKFAQQLKNNGFALRRLNLLTDKLEGIDALIIAASDKPWLAGEIDKLMEYIKQGGNLLWLHDPGKLSQLQQLADTLDIEFLKGVVVDDDPGLRKTLGIQHPSVVPIIQYGDHPITRQIRYNTLFPIAEALKSREESDWQHSPLLITLPESWSDTDGLSLKVSYEADKGDQKGPLYLGIALQRPADDNREQRIVVIGDSDFLANTYVGAGANLLLGLNIMNWLGEDDELINIDPRSAPDLSLQLDDTQILFISFSFLVALPLLLLLGGIVIWRRRKKS